MIAPNENIPPVCPRCGADLWKILLGHAHAQPSRLVCSRVWDHYPVGVSLNKEERETLPVSEQGRLPPKPKPGPWERAFAKSWRAFERSVADHMEVIERLNPDGQRLILARWAPSGGLVGRLLPPEHAPLSNTEDQILNVLYADYVALMRQAQIATVLPWIDWRARYLAVQACRAG